MRLRPKFILLLLVPVLASTALLAATLPAGAPLERGRPGDGAPDAPVPAVGEAGGPSRVLTPAEMAQWLRGRALFDHDFHRSEGLGAPNMNGDSCRACHHDPAIGGAGPLEVNVSRCGYDNGGLGPFTDLPGGQGLSKLRPPFHAGREEYDPATADVFEQRQTPTLFGAGLIDSISAATIVANEDPDDLDADGVRGVARRIDAGGVIEVGRFGWKAQLPRLTDFTRDALAQECGITTADDGRGFSLETDADGVADPELAGTALDDLVFFMANLAPPKPTGSTDPAFAAGEALFDSVGCAACHVPTLAGAGGPVPLYSDLLLHKVMSDVERGMAEPGAPVGVYRTPPLWGNCRTAPYLHDGRAETVDAAIRAHLGEADATRVRYLLLTPQERADLLFFLAQI